MLSPAAIRVPRAKRTKKAKAPCNQQIGDVDHSWVITQAHVRDCTRRRRCVRQNGARSTFASRYSRNATCPTVCRKVFSKFRSLLADEPCKPTVRTRSDHHLPRTPQQNVCSRDTQDQRISIGHARGEVVKLMLAPSQTLLYLHVDKNRNSQVESFENTNERCSKTFEIANHRSTVSAKLDSKSGFSLTHMSEKVLSKSRTLETLTRAADASIESQKVSVLQQMNGCCRRSVNCLSRGRQIRIVASTTTQTVLSSEFTASSHTKLSSQALH